MTHGLDDTARLILLDLPVRSVAMFVRELRDYHPEVSLVDAGHLWDKYMGRDGRIFPTHDLVSGERL